MYIDILLIYYTVVNKKVGLKNVVNFFLLFCNNGAHLCSKAVSLASHYYKREDGSIKKLGSKINSKTNKSE